MAGNEPLRVDGHHSDEELWAFITTFAPRFETQLQRATPNDVRRAGLVAGKASWLEKPSVLFEILCLLAEAWQKRHPEHTKSR